MRGQSGSSRQGVQLRVPPHSKDAELAVLGGIMLRNDTVHEASEFLHPEDFYIPAHAAIFAAMRTLDQRGQPIDPVSLEEQLKGDGNAEKVGGIEYLVDLAGRVPTAENLGYYVKIVREKSLLRKLIQTVSEVAAEAYTEPSDVEEFLDRSEHAVFEISETTNQSSFVPVEPIIKNLLGQALEWTAAGTGGVTGVPTGFEKLDELTGGFQPGDLVIVAARPGLGKTSLALNIVQHVAMAHSIPGLVFSLEMNKQQLVERMLCSEARVNLSDFRRRMFAQEDWNAITEAASRFMHAPIYIDDTPSASILQVRNKCRRFRANRRIFKEPDSLGLIAVDYLQLMRGPSERLESREREIAEISRGLKALAKELNMPVLALSQLNRNVESREDKRPRLADLRESGAIEQDADVIMFIYRDAAYKKGRGPDEPEAVDNSAELIIGKHRNGPTGTVHLVYLGQYTRFENAARDPLPPF